MNSNDAVSETSGSEGKSGAKSAMISTLKRFGPSVLRRFGSSRFGSSRFAVASGGITLLRAVRNFRKGKRKRGLIQLAVGLFWVGAVLAQRRRKKGSAGSELSDVADTSPDVEDAVEPGNRETDHATGEEVVDTMDADIEESDTAPEVEQSSEREQDENADVDQRDVTGSTDVEDVTETADDSEAADDSETAESRE